MSGAVVDSTAALSQGTTTFLLNSGTLTTEAGVLASENFTVGTTFDVAIVQTAAAGGQTMTIGGTGGTGAIGNVYFGSLSRVDNTTASVVSPLLLGFTSAGTGKGGELTAISSGSGNSGTYIIHRLSSDATTSQARTSKLTKRIGVYSFALKPEEHQPSGTCNFSRIDNAQLTGTTSVNTTEINIYAVNYNVLRIMSGMGGLAYSN
jgi:hypothetical protein